MSLHLIAFSRLVILFGLAAWLSIAIINNITDPVTNSHLLGQTLSMELVKTEAFLGAGLTWRAWPAAWSSALLYLVITVQVTIAFFLWRAVITYIRALIRNDITILVQGRNRAIFALSLFVLLWMWFICGGLWFGYWLKQGAIQNVHMTLILIGLGALLYVQAQPTPACSTSGDLADDNAQPIHTSFH